MDIYRWLFQSLGRKGVESTAEEFNRYANPPKGIDQYEWFTHISRAKYGDFLSGTYWKKRDKENGS